MKEKKTRGHPEKHDRNAEVIEDCKHLLNFTIVGDKHEISRQRVSEIWYRVYDDNPVNIVIQELKQEYENCPINSSISKR